MPTHEEAKLTRPIIGIENRTPQEVFDIMCDRIRSALTAAEQVRAPSGGVKAHPDDLAVDRFAAAMKAKLVQKRAEGRGGWDDPEQCTAEFLSELLREHVEKGDPLDVGNLAMMLHQRGDRIRSALTGASAVGEAAPFEQSGLYGEYTPVTIGPAPVQPGDGWVLVPRVPTLGMIIAHDELQNARGIPAFANSRDIWAAMISAAPTKGGE